MVFLEEIVCQGLNRLGLVFRWGDIEAAGIDREIESIEMKFGGNEGVGQPEYLSCRRYLTADMSGLGVSIREQAASYRKNRLHS